ncbi:MAG: glycosyltransferase [Bacteroidales bacterium]|nr:glycosyltransferase [Bacteroidales bacterium]
MKVICIGNYPPRQCGIATFTENLVQAIIQAAGIHTTPLNLEVIAMNDPEQSYPYPYIVSHSINDQAKQKYVEMADYINASGADICLLQHEFGIYGGESGLLILSLLRRLRVPIVTTFHTVLEKPGFHQLEVMKKIAGYSSRIVIMNGLAIRLLTDVYQVPVAKIIRIQHGVPDFEAAVSKLSPRPEAWVNRKIMLTFGLIGRSKGIETVIRAMPQIAEKHPEILYVVLGKTHPHVVRYAGEEYREYLMKLTNDLGMTDHVQFMDQYTSEIELMSLLKAADLYVTPYLNKAQITSGTLSYAVSGGCAVLSTPYWHAEELLAENRGVLFGFGNSPELATHVIHLLDNPKELNKLQQNAFNYGKTITWPLIGYAYVSLFSQVIALQKLPPTTPLKDQQRQYPEIDLSHLKRMTDDTGLLQHARSCVPHYKTGYCLDDNARALIVSLMEWNRTHDRKLIRQINKYLAYINFMQQKDGSYKNYLTFSRLAFEDDHSDDTLGRTIWALGYLVRHAPVDALFYAGLELFNQSLPQLEKLRYARGYANSILGLYHYSKRFPDQEKMLHLSNQLATHLCEQFKRISHGNWHWFEETITYDNGMIPASLYKAYQLTGNREFFEVAEKSREFLELKCFPNAWLSLVGNRRWLMMDADYELFAQQPIDAMAMVYMYASAYDATGNIAHIQKLITAFDWFFGENDLNLPLYDPTTGGCMDGIEEFCINRNQGAESTISYLLARLLAEPFLP